MNYCLAMLTKNSLVLKKTIRSLAIGWTFLILILCLVRFGDLPEVKVEGGDKYVHFTFHFMFTLLWSYSKYVQQRQISVRDVMKIVLFSLLYGILIEFLQEAFTVTRHADIFDVLANLAGAFTAFLVVVGIKRFKED